MMLVHIFGLLTEAVFYGWERVEWAIAWHICESLIRAIGNL